MQNDGNKNKGKRQHGRHPRKQKQVPPPPVVSPETQQEFDAFNEQVHRLKTRNAAQDNHVSSSDGNQPKAKIVRAKHKTKAHRPTQEDYEYVEIKEDKKDKAKKYLLLALILFCFLAGFFILFWALGWLKGDDFNNDQSTKKLVETPLIKDLEDDGKAEINKINQDSNKKEEDSDTTEDPNRHQYSDNKKTLGTFEYIGYGANRCVSGSFHKIKIDGETLILDSGSFYGFDYKTQAKLTPEVYADVDAILISHGHLDHIGRMLELVKGGYKGKFYCSEPTKEIMPIMLHMIAKTGYFGTEKFMYSKYWYEKNQKRGENTAVHLFEDCDGARKIKPDDKEFLETSRNKLAERGMYLCADCAWRIVERAMKQVIAKPLHEKFRPTPNLEVMFYSTPHMPGAVMGWIRSLKSNHSLLWTGDYGSGTSPFLAPQEYPDIDPTWAIIEGTYPAEVKSGTKKDRDELVRYIGECLAQNKRVVIPAFVLDRSQQVLSELTKGINKGYIKLRDRNMIKIFSPTIAKINNLYSRVFKNSKYAPYFSEDFMKNGPFNPDIFSVGYKAEDVGYGEIAIASSGMADFSFAYDMVKKWISDPNTVFILVSYQAPSSVGGRIYDAKQRGDKTITFEDVKYDLNAEVIRKGSFSGHGKVDQIADFLARYKTLQNVLIVHSDPDNVIRLGEAYRKILPQYKYDMPEGGKKYTYKSSKNVPEVVNHGNVGAKPNSNKDSDNDEGNAEDDRFPALKLITLDKSKIKVARGDYFYYDDMKLELNNVDAPYPASSWLKDGASQDPYATQAIELVKKMIADAKTVQAIRIKYVSYEKYQIYLLCDGKNVNAELLRQSLVYLKPAAEKYGAQGCDKYWKEIMDASKNCKPQFENPYTWYKKNQK